MLAVEEPGTHLSKVLFAGLIAPLRHILDGFGVIKLDFYRGLLVDTQVPGRAEEAIRQRQSAMLLGGEKEICAVKRPTCLAV